MRLFDFALLAWLLNRHARQTMPTDRLEALEAAEEAAAAEKAARKAENRAEGAALFVCVAPCVALGAWIYSKVGFNPVFVIVSLVLGLIIPIAVSIFIVTRGLVDVKTMETVAGVFGFIYFLYFSTSVFLGIYWLLK